MSPIHRRCVLALAALIAAVFAIEWLSPSDIYDNDQPGPIAHIVDVARNRQWLAQRGPDGTMMSKPPMYPWLGAACVLATGRATEFVFKLPLIGGFLIVTLVVFDLGRRTFGVVGGCVAAAMWTCNYPVFKLAYTARPDMLVAAWLAVGLWSTHLQQLEWARGRASSMWLVALFWLAFGANLLTKGPPALIGPLWLLIIVAYDRPGRRCRPAAQLLGCVLAAAPGAWWLHAVLTRYPDWLHRLNFEVVDRIMGTGRAARYHSTPLAMPGYFFARFFPWSVLFVLGAAYALGRAGRGLPRWPVAWTVMVVVIFMVPKGRRADYILPAYLGASVLAAGFAVRVAEISPRRRRVVSAGMAAAFVAVVIAFGVYSFWFSAAVRTGAGEAIYHAARVARDAAAARQAPVACYEVGYTPVQALLGTNLPMDGSALARVDGGGVLVADADAWDKIAQRYAGRATVLMETEKLPESKVRLIVLKIGPSPTKTQ